MKLADLLVSYKQVESPKFKNTIDLKFPESYNYQFTYSEPKKETLEETPAVEEDSKNIEFRFTPIGVKQNNGSKAVVRWTSPYITNKNQWVIDMTQAYKRLGLNDNAIKNLIAKNALESSWGKSAQGSYNFGNITTGSSWKGAYVKGRDKNSNGQGISQKFRAYNSLDEYVKDELQFLTKLYDFDQNDNFDTFIGKLQGNNKGKRMYAEDKQYINKVRKVYNSL